MDNNCTNSIEIILKIANMNIDALINAPISAVSEPLLAFAELVKKSEQIADANLKGSEIWRDITELIQKDDSTAAFTYLEIIQKILTQTLKQIVSSNKQLRVHFSGTITMSAQGYGEDTPSRTIQSFAYTFVPEKKPFDAEDLVNLVLLNIISSCRLEPDRFGICAWVGCKKYFYKEKSKKKLFCSVNCSKLSSKADKTINQ